MIFLGITTVYPHQERGYITELAKRAERYNIQVCRFCPSNIHPVSELVEGYMFDSQSQEWKQATFSLPPFIYDRCFYDKSERSRKTVPIVDWLKKRKDIKFLGKGLPNKWDIYKVIIENYKLAPYVPETKQYTTASNFIKDLRQQKQLILKPVVGSQGNGVIKVIYDSLIRIVTNSKKKQRIEQTFPTKQQFEIWLEKLTNKIEYLYQPYLTLHDSLSRPFDIRVLLQKDESGLWQEKGRGIRIGAENQIISNLSGGADALPFDKLYNLCPQMNEILLEDDIHTIIEQLPITLEQHFSSLFELGVDIGIDQDGRMWILDTNSKPGRKVLLQTKPTMAEELYEAPLKYCLFLAATNKVK
ncbi:YheC/YheD family protein [Bacillus sp. HMF5848]|uniref:YheC/YheD family endospore coat-associated protein n=1 Tax=Bacillus sp. HMF5848 TaxID=2495421 RepID=UPI000F7A10AD|nr:YheC/YheD family protein [Bacillus sp. HMF5848]RSK26298.1 YheC/YheD family protein [Bacillus sp. HMF5848]